MLNRQTVMLHVSDTEVLQNLLRMYELDLDGSGPRRLADGEVGLVAFVTQDQIEVIREVQGITVTEIDLPKQPECAQMTRTRLQGRALHPSQRRS